MTDMERYGNTRISKIKAAYDDLRAAIRAGDIEKAEAALDRYEQWADYAFAPPIQSSFIAAADALAEALDIPAQSDGKMGRYHYEWERIDGLMDRYRAARDALTKGTPPAFATSA